MVSSIVNTSTISAETIKLGETVNINASAQKGSGGYQYEVYYKKAADTKWVTKQKFSTNANLTFKPTNVGPYELSVKAKDSDGNIDKKRFTLTVQSALVNTSTVSAETIKLGETVTINASADKGSGGYQYEVYYKKSADTKWVTKQKFSTKATVSFTPDKAATYNVCVRAKDGTGTVEKAYLDVTVK